MDINSINIQMTQTISALSPAGTGNNARQTVSSASGGTTAQKPQALKSLVDGNFVKDQIEEIITTFPPYFPAGSPQRVDLIKGVQGVQEEIKSSLLSADTKDKLAGQQLTGTSTDKEISTALKGIQQYTDKHLQSPAPAANKSQAGNIVSIEI